MSRLAPILRRGLVLSLLALPLFLRWARAEEYWHQKNYGPKARQAIMRDLYEGQVRDVQPFHGKDHLHEIYKGTLHNPNTGTSRRVFIKVHRPEMIFSGNSFDNPIGEAVAHKLDVMLRGAYIAPAANRRGIAMNGWTSDYSTIVLGLKSKGGPVVSSWQQDMSRSRPHDVELTASDIAIRGALLGNLDIMHNPNIVLADHWVDGETSTVALDWAGMFKTDQRLEHGAAIRRQPVTRFNLATYQALKKLSLADLERDMSDSTIPRWLAPWQMSRILSTRDGIVGFIDGQIRLRGADDVFFRKPDGSWDPGPYGWLDPS